MEMCFLPSQVHRSILMISPPFSRAKAAGMRFTFWSYTIAASFDIIEFFENETAVEDRC